MAGIDDAVIGDWAPQNPSTGTLVSSPLTDDFRSRSFSDILGENQNVRGTEKQKVEVNLDDDENDIGLGLSGNRNMFYGEKSSSSRGSLAERMAARAGFSAPRLNTARVRSGNPLSSSFQEVRSPYITIPPGLSPTTLLDSPVFLSNSLAQPSPTTGKFPLTQCTGRSLMAASAASDKHKVHPFDDADTASFAFKPHQESNSSYYPSAANKVTSGGDDHQFFPSIEVSVQSEDVFRAQHVKSVVVHSQNQQGFQPHSDFPKSSIGREAIGNTMPNPRVTDAVVKNAEYSPSPDNQEDGGQKGELPSMTVGAPSDDGYNWRKYGQKQVKGSEYPRSYYKCTHPNCQVKKKVERSHEGHITEIIYKGAHNHPKPPPSRRSTVGFSNSPNDIDIGENNSAHGTSNGETMWPNTHHEAVNVGPDWTNDGKEIAASASAATEFCDPPTSTVAKNGFNFESAEAVDVSSTLSNDEEDDDRGTHGSVSQGYDDDGDESESKRRKIDTSVAEISGATRAIREPRVVVQTTSEVDILDDGYRWRKYGQKVVKGNPNPRSYYKCTNAGCTVRKHVERASNDLKSVITTYEGKHNHDVPAARNSSHVSSNIPPAPPAPNYTSRLELSQVHNGMPRFDGPASLGTFDLAGRHQLGPTSTFSFGMNQPRLANLAMAGLGSSQGKMPVLRTHTYLAQRKPDEAGFVMPKGEPGEESVPDSGLQAPNGSVYHQIMSRLPLGPQM